MSEKTNSMQQLKIDLRDGNIQRLYIFHGEEVFLLQHYLNQLKNRLIDPLTESFNFHKLTRENFDIRNLSNAVECVPMMADHTFVLIDDIDIFKLSDSDKEIIAEILSDIPDYCTIAFTFETVQWKLEKKLKKLYDLFCKEANIVEFPKQELRDLISWVTRHFSALKKKIDPNLCSYLIEITGGTMTALSGEISKIAAYSEAEQITKSDIDAVTEPVLDAVVFQMTDLLGEGKYSAALEKLQKLLKMQQEPLAILGAIGVHFRRLTVAKILLENGKNTGDLMRLYNVREYPAKKIMGAVRNFTASFLEKASVMIMETDRHIKTSFDDAERLLEVLILTLAQEARNG
mgnify:CR=1 FL=1